MPTKTTIQCFLAAAECLNFTQTAESLYFSRQAVSQQIGKLEKELGTTLFTRNPLALTPEGELYAAYYRRCLEKWMQTQEQLAQMALNQQVIRIAGVADLALDEGMRSLFDYCGRQYPGLELMADRRDPYDLITLLTNKEIDLAICTDSMEFVPRQNLQMESALITELAPILITRKENMLPEKSLHELLLLPCYISTVPGQSDMETERLFRQHWSQYGLSFSRVQVLRNRDSVLSTICFSHGIMAWVDGSESLFYPGTTAVPLNCAPIPLRAYWRRDDKAVLLRSLADYLHEYYTEHPMHPTRPDA